MNQQKMGAETICFGAFKFFAKLSVSAEGIIVEQERQRKKHE